MRAYLMRLARKIFGRYDFPEPPDDPSAGVREPRRRSPGGRHSAVAVEEPEPPSDVRAIGEQRFRRH